MSLVASCSASATSAALTQVAHSPSGKVCSSPPYTSCCPGMAPTTTSLSSCQTPITVYCMAFPRVWVPSTRYRDSDSRGGRLLVGPERLGTRTFGNGEVGAGGGSLAGSGCSAGGERSGAAGPRFGGGFDVSTWRP